MIRLLNGGDEIPVSYSTFPGGEEHVRISSAPAKYSLLRVEAVLDSSREILRLLLLDSALGESGCSYYLVLPYLPYARQDRVCNAGEANSLEVFMRVVACLRHCEFVRCADVHNPAVLLKNGESYSCIGQDTIFLEWNDLYEFCKRENVVVVSPDKGAIHKATDVADALSVNLILANKVRDSLSGKIVETTIPKDEIDPSRHYLIVDDICDGGRTFIELAKVMKEAGATKISLYTTHGIFSAGWGELSKYFDSIWTTNSWKDRRPLVYKGMEVHTFDIFSIM